MKKNWIIATTLLALPVLGFCDEECTECSDTVVTEEVVVEEVATVEEVTVEEVVVEEVAAEEVAVVEETADDAGSEEPTEEAV